MTIYLFDHLVNLLALALKQRWFRVKYSATSNNHPLLNIIISDADGGDGGDTGGGRGQVNGYANWIGRESAAYF